MQTLATTDHKPHKFGRTVLILVLASLTISLIAAISIPNLLRSRMAADQAAQRAGSGDAGEKLADSSAGSMADPATADQRRIVQTGNMHLTVGDPAAVLEQIAGLSRDAGGFVESSELYHSANEIAGANITIRVPAKDFESTRAEIRRLGKRIDRESANSNDITGQFVDVQATLRNYRAEEAQYLGIMRDAANVKETLEVAQRLSEVRGRIERTEAQLNLMSRQAEMASIAITLRAELGPDAQVSWSPLHQLRAAWSDALQGFADYLNLMLVVLFRIPLVLAWAFTACGLAALGWRVLRWIWQHWFSTSAAQPAL
jgi:hypothetical protein